MKLVCDVMLGKLAKYLRLLGFDAVYLRDLSGLKALQGSEEPWVFITRRTKFLRCAKSLGVRSELTRQQVTELKDFLKPLIDRSRVMNRCIKCNLPLEDIERNEVEHRVPEFVFHHYKRFRQCSSCKRVYWEGSHAKHMAELLKELLD